MIKIQGSYSRPEPHKGGYRIRVLEGTVEIGQTVTAMEFRGSAHGGNTAAEFRVTGLGAAWTERGYVIDEEDARSFGGGGKIRVGSPGRLQYAYVVRA